MYYLVRGSSGPGPSIGLATSFDGISWTRRGTVISASLPEEAGGLSLAYACQRSNGEYVLVYHGYSSDLEKGVALVATASPPIHIFSGKTIVKSFDNFSTTITATAGANNGTVELGVIVPLGIPLLINGQARETVVAKRQDGTQIWFDHPLLNSYAGAMLYSMAKNKVELSYIKEKPDGTWAGIFTLYNPAALLAEYTTEGTAPSLTGPWDYSKTGLRFLPWPLGTLYSLENPSPLVTSASCAN